MDLLDLNVVDLVGEHTVESQAEAFGARLDERDPTTCCRLNKVRPFARALHGFDAWATALRRAQIGCAPCTRMLFRDEGERDGRWDGSQKVECGIHAIKATREPRPAAGRTIP